MKKNDKISRTQLIGGIFSKGIRDITTPGKRVSGLIDIVITTPFMSSIAIVDAMGLSPKKK